MGSIPERGRDMVSRVAARSLCGESGTCLGVLYENTAYGRR